MEGIKIFIAILVNSLVWLPIISIILIWTELEIYDFDKEIKIKMKKGWKTMEKTIIRDMITEDGREIILMRCDLTYEMWEDGVCIFTTQNSNIAHDKFENERQDAYDNYILNNETEMKQGEL